MPPLNALRAFDAAARHQSFARAGAELTISPGAISRQVKILESALGAVLFRRAAQGVVLTEAGRRLLAQTDAAFDILARAFPGNRQGPLTFHVASSFYLRWLLPRLASLQPVVPRQSFNFDVAGNRAGPLENGDISILYRRADAPVDADTSECLFVDRSILVCAPALLSRRRSSLPLSALRHLPLLLNTADDWDWRAAAVQWHLPSLSFTGAIRFDLDDGAIQGALAGQGIGLVEQRFVADDLVRGTLVRPFDLPPLSLGEYRLCWRAGVARRAAVLKLRVWLREQIARQSV